MKKGDKTRLFILEQAKQCFSQHGYATVTMKDICELCQLSRGGLYRYFGSTKEIFLELLEADKDDKGEMMLESMAKDTTAAEMLRWFLQDRKATTIVGESAGFSFAIQEFIRQEPEQRTYMKERRLAAEKGLVMLLEYGQKRGEFKSVDAQTTALTMLLLLDSLEINAQTLEMNGNEIDCQLAFLYGLVTN